MKNVVALINLYSSPEFGLLTEKRPAASTTILGRYTFIDFTLSNLTNSGIDDIGIMVKNNSRSIIKHLRSDSAYLKNSKTGFVNWMINEQGFHNPFFNTDINNIKENDYFLYDDSCKYVIILPVGIVMKCDYSKMIEEHIKSGKEVSIIYTETEDAGKEYFGLSKITVNALGNVQKVDDVDKKDKKAYVSLRSFIINKETLKRAIKDLDKISNVYSLKDLIIYMQRYNSLEVHACRYDGRVTFVNSLQKYYETSMLYKDIILNDRENTFPDDWKIYTRTHDTRPTLYGKDSEVKDSILANGSTILGTVKNSVLARNVIVEEGAIVENSIIFSDTVIKKGVHLKNVVGDKLCTFENKKEVFGKDNEVIYIPQGAKI